MGIFKIDPILILVIEHRRLRHLKAVARYGFFLDGIVNHLKVFIFGQALKLVRPSRRLAIVIGRSVQRDRPHHLIAVFHADRKRLGAQTILIIIVVPGLFAENIDAANVVFHDDQLRAFIARLLFAHGKEELLPPRVP